MYDFKIQNERGEILELTHNQNYIIKSITGLTPMGATIQTTTIGNKDGARYNSSRANVRNIVVNVSPSYPVDENRIALYNYLQVGKNIRVFYKNNIRNVYIDGYVESVDGDLFEKGETMQVSILCPQPYFIAVEDTERTLLNVLSLFETPFTIPLEGMAFSEVINENLEFNNQGEKESGLYFEVEFSTYIGKITIRDNVRNETFSIEYDFQPYDVLQINTNTGEKEVTLIRCGKAYNLMSILILQNQWLRTSLGFNSFSITTDKGSQNFRLSASWNEMYQGV